MRIIRRYESNFRLDAGPEIRYVGIGGLVDITLTQAKANTSRIVWTQISGNPVTISDPNTISPSISFPNNYIYGYDIVLRLSSVDFPSIYSDVEILPLILEKLKPSILSQQDDRLAACLQVGQPILSAPDPTGIERVIVFDNDSPIIYFRNQLPTCDIDNLKEIEWQIHNNGIYQFLSTTTLNFGTTIQQTPNHSRIRSRAAFGVLPHWKMSTPYDVDVTSPIYFVDDTINCSMASQQGVSVEADRWFYTGKSEFGASEDIFSEPSILGSYGSSFAEPFVFYAARSQQTYNDDINMSEPTILPGGSTSSEASRVFSSSASSLG